MFISGLNEFIKKGIDTESEKLALPLIIAFYCGLIISREYSYFRQLTTKELIGIADVCARRFIENCRMLYKDKSNYFVLEDEVIRIASNVMNEFFYRFDNDKNTQYPQMFSQSSSNFRAYNPDNPDSFNLVNQGIINEYNGYVKNIFPSRNNNNLTFYNQAPQVVYPIQQDPLTHNSLYKQKASNEKFQLMDNCQQSASITQNGLWKTNKRPGCVLKSDRKCTGSSPYASS